MSDQQSLRQLVMDEIRAEMEKLKPLQGRVVQAAAQGHAAAREDLERLAQEMETTRKKVFDLAGPSGAALEEIRSGAAKAYDELAEAGKKAAARFNRPT